MTQAYLWQLVLDRLDDAGIAVAISAGLKILRTLDGFGTPVTVANNLVLGVADSSHISLTSNRRKI